MNPQRFAGIAWPGIFVIITGIYVYWKSQGDLVSRRPPPPVQYDVPHPVPDPGVSTVHSRMWEDPITTAYQSWIVQGDNANWSPYPADRDSTDLNDSVRKMAQAERRILKSPSDKDHRSPTASVFESLAQSQLTLLAVFVPGGPYSEDKETRMRTRYAVVTALAEAGYHLKFPRRMSFVETLIHVRVLRGWQERRIIVPVKLYQPADSEGASRPQILVMWINESELGLRPLLATNRVLRKIFVNIDQPDNIRLKIIGPSSSGTLSLMREEASYARREKHFGTTLDEILKAAEQIDQLAKSDSPTNRQEIMSWTRTVDRLCGRVFAIDDPIARESAKRLTDSIERTTKQIRTEAESVHRAEQRRQTRDGALDIATLAGQIKKLSSRTLDHWFVSTYNQLKPIAGYSPLWLPERPQPGGPRKPQVVEVFSPRATVADHFPDSERLTLQRVIGNDKQLVGRIKDELGQRGALSGRVVLITEHDTEYGRQIAEAFVKALGKGRTTSIGVLRGIDGSRPGKDGQESPRVATKPSGSSGEGDIAERAPAGRSQFDYLRRLPQAIKDKNLIHRDSHATTHEHEVDHKHEQVTAIGVVGSDVYDKLLVLRALKPHFPDCVFFTTDMEAIYTHTDEKRHTRNLIIASHFGLQLHSDLQQRTLPFRDSYQTATFLATRLAVGHGSDNLSSIRKEIEDYSKTVNAPSTKATDWWLRPLMYVVGRDRSYQLKGGSLNGAAQSKINVHPTASERLDGEWHVFFSIAFALLAFCSALVWLNRHCLGESPFLHSLIAALSSAILHTGAWICDVIASLLPESRLRQRAERLQRRLGRRCNDHAAEDRAGDDFRSPVNISVFVLFMIGIGLFVYGLKLEDAQYFVGGHTMWPKHMIYAITGILAVTASAYLLDRIWHQLKVSCIDDRSESKFVGMASCCFGRAQILTIGVIAPVLTFSTVGLSYELTSHFAIASFAAIFAGLVIVWVYYEFFAALRSTEAPPLDSMVLTHDARPATRFSVICVVALFGIFTLCHWLDESHVGWHPTEIGRSHELRLLDEIITGYALACVGLLFAAILYSYVWIWELSCSAVSEFEEFRADPDRLWLVGKLTSIVGSVGPALMGLLLLLVLAYHPMMSPHPMPMGLLVVTSLTIVAFLASVLMTRRHFHNDRQRVLREIQDEIHRLNRTIADDKGDVTFTPSGTTQRPGNSSDTKEQLTGAL